MSKKPKTVVAPAPLNPEQQVTPQVVVEAAPVPEKPVSQVAAMSAPVEPEIKEVVEEAVPSTIPAVDIGTTVVVEDQRSAAFRSIEARLNGYATAMAPNAPMDKHTGCNNQLELRSILLSVFKLPIVEFQDAMSLVLDTFRRHAGGAFQSAYVFRFFDELHLTNAELDTFSGLLRLYILACNPATRQSVAQRVDFNKLAAGLGDTDGQLLLAYFKRP